MKNIKKVVFILLIINLLISGCYSSSSSLNFQNCIEITKKSDRTDEYGWLVISGEAKNNCNFQAIGKIYFTIYDANGNVLSSEFAFTNPYEIPAGATKSFERTWTDETVYSRAKSYKVEGSSI